MTEHFDGEGFETLLWFPGFLTKEPDTQRSGWVLCDAPTLLYTLLVLAGHLNRIGTLYPQPLTGHDVDGAVTLTAELLETDQHTGEIRTAGVDDAAGLLRRLASSAANVLLIGGPGSGKTTLLKQLATDTGDDVPYRYRFYLDLGLKLPEEDFADFVTRQLTPSMMVPRNRVVDVFLDLIRLDQQLHANGVDPLNLPHFSVLRLHERPRTGDGSNAMTPLERRLAAPTGRDPAGLPTDPTRRLVELVAARVDEVLTTHQLRGLSARLDDVLGRGHLLDRDVFSYADLCSELGVDAFRDEDVSAEAFRVTYEAWKDEIDSGHLHAEGPTPVTAHPATCPPFPCNGSGASSNAAPPAPARMG